MKFISLFAGVGGFDLGMERAGHECVAQVEWDKNAAGVLKRLQATYTLEELEELGVGTTYPKTLGEYLNAREDQG